MTTIHHPCSLMGFRFTHVDISSKMRKMSPQCFHLQSKGSWVCPLPSTNFRLSAQQNLEASWNSAAPPCQLHGFPNPKSHIRGPSTRQQHLSGYHVPWAGTGFTQVPWENQSQDFFLFHLRYIRITHPVLLLVYVPFRSSSMSPTTPLPCVFTHQLCAHLPRRVLGLTHTML